MEREIVWVFPVAIFGALTLKIYSASRHTDVEKHIVKRIDISIEIRYKWLNWLDVRTDGMQKEEEELMFWKNEIY